jgi:hypothetical protein
MAGKLHLNLLACAALAAVGATAAPHAAAAKEFVVNGSFEADNFNAGSGFRLGLVGNDVTGWFIPASDGTYPWGLQNANAFSAGPAADGNQWLVLGETGAGGPSMVDFTIQQTITGLTPGNTYTLSFDLASELDHTGAIAEVSFLSGTKAAPADFTAPAIGPTFWNPWSAFSEKFVATDTTAVLQFKDLAVESPLGGDVGIDKVSITGGIPEPASWAMMLVGFGAIGWAARRRLRTA